MTEYVKNVEDLGSPSLVLLVKAIGDTLERHFSGWLWAIMPDEAGGVLSIHSLRLSMEWGYRFKLTDLSSPQVAQKLVINAAGEILERFGMKRGAYSYADWSAAARLMGLPTPDISDRSLKVQRRERDAALSRALQFGQAKLRVRTHRDGDQVRTDYGLKVNG